jgi:hypothetical protein
MRRLGHGLHRRLEFSPGQGAILVRIAGGERFADAAFAFRRIRRPLLSVASRRRSARSVAIAALGRRWWRTMPFRTRRTATTLAGAARRRRGTLIVAVATRRTRATGTLITAIARRMLGPFAVARRTLGPFAISGGSLRAIATVAAFGAMLLAALGEAAQTGAELLARERAVAIGVEGLEQLFRRRWGRRGAVLGGGQGLRADQGGEHQGEAGMAHGGSSDPRQRAVVPGLIVVR